MEVTHSEQSKESDDNQIDRNNEIEQARHDQDKDAGYQGDQRTNGEGDVHADLQSKWVATNPAVAAAKIPQTASPKAPAKPRSAYVTKRSAARHVRRAANFPRTPARAQWK